MIGEYSLVFGPRTPTSPAIRTGNVAFDTARTFAIVNHLTYGCSFKWHRQLSRRVVVLRPRVRRGCGVTIPPRCDQRAMKDEGRHATTASGSCDEMDGSSRSSASGPLRAC
jgi:hypothetical protein